MKETCALEGCGQPLGETFWTARGLKYHSLGHLGYALSQPFKKRKSKREKHSAGWRGRRKRFLKETAGVNMNPTAPESPPPVIHQEYETEKIQEPWAKVKYNKETFLADEVVVLTRTAPNMPLSLMLSNMRNVRMYVDDVGGVLLRPVRPSTEAGTGSGAQTASGSKKKARESSVDGQERKPRALPVALTGSRNLNPAKPESKRWYLVESMLEGGTTKEIFKRAASNWAKATNNKRDKYGMVSTPSNARLMFGWLVEKLATVGKHVSFKEKDGKFKVYDA